MLDGLRLAVSLFTVIPVPAGTVDRRSAGHAMVLAVIPGLLVGLAAAATVLAGRRLGFGDLLSAGLAVAVMAALTRGLHLDGLADLADGLGSAKPASESLETMKKSDIGPFGVITLVLTLLIQVAAIARCPVEGIVVAAVTGRLAVTWACRPAVPCARPGGLGSLVAGTVPVWSAAVVSVVVLAAASAMALPLGAAVIVGLAASAVLLGHAVRRLGGVTGDVFGALVEVAVTAALLTSCVRFSL
jgi:adenosylcobinamide-GDP ribazoletransferase